MSGLFLTRIDELVDEIRTAARRAPLDWGTIRGAAMSLDDEARTNDQRAAVERLKRALDSHSVDMAVSAVEQAFLQGKPDVDGWPRKG